MPVVPCLGKLQGFGGKSPQEFPTKKETLKFRFSNKQNRRKMMDLAKILQEKQCVLSVIGPHAGETMFQIYERKIQDIGTVGKTFWHISCDKAIFEKINELCVANKDLYIIFIAPGGRNGSRPATTETAASGYTVNDKFFPFPKKMSPVTGQVGGTTAALVFDELQLVDEESAPELDTWNYLDAVKQESLRFILGRSTVPCVLNPNPTEGMINHLRKISAIGHFASPFCVRLRQ